MKRIDAEKICRQFGNDPSEMLKGWKAFADEELDALVEEAPVGEVNVEPVIEEEVVKVGNEDDLIARLQAMVDNEETAKEDKKTAEELMARLEELKAAKTNAEEFLKGKEKMEEKEEKAKPVEIPEMTTEVPAPVPPMA